MRKKITYFLEDRAQETFIRALVERVAREEGCEIESDVRSATRGSQVLDQLKRFVDQATRQAGGVPAFDVLVAAIDGNCQTRAKKVREIMDIVQGTGLESRTVCCVPDPHIERWYCLDEGALRRAVHPDVSVTVPRYKCDKAFYKRLLGDALSPVRSLMGGAEYGEAIASEIAYDVVTHRTRRPSGLPEFLDDLRRHLRTR